MLRHLDVLLDISFLVAEEGDVGMPDTVKSTIESKMLYIRQLIQTRRGPFKKPSRGYSGSPSSPL